MKLSELYAALKQLELPKEIQLSAHEKIIDVPKFIEHHYTILISNPKNKRFLPYYERLLKLYNLLK